MKNTSIIFVIALGLLATSFIYYSFSRPEENEIKPVSQTTSKYARSIAACKNARLDISGIIFQMSGGVGEALDPYKIEDKLKLEYADKGVRGYMDNGSAFDMVCAYRMTNSLGVKSNYVAVLLGLTEDVYAPIGTTSIGGDITISTMDIEAGRLKISTKDNQTGVFQDLTFMLEGDAIIAL